MPVGVCTKLVSSLKAAAESSIPRSSQDRRTGVAGWLQFVKPELEASRWWYKLWIDAGSPSAGVLFQLKKHAYGRYKYAVHRVRRRQEHLKQMKLAEALLKDPTHNFWTKVHSFAGSRKPLMVPVVDGVSGQDNISDLWCNNFKQLYNSSDGALSADLLRTLEMEISSQGIAKSLIFVRNH